LAGGSGDGFDRQASFRAPGIGIVFSRVAERPVRALPSSTAIGGKISDHDFAIAFLPAAVYDELPPEGIVYGKQANFITGAGV
jgi:hypothetical protein